MTELPSGSTSALAAAPMPAAPSEATARMADGTLLRTLRWDAVGEPWAVALIVHGLGEHGGRYGNVAAALTAAGIEVHAYDHRGFGGSAGRRAYVDRWEQLHDDLQERLAAVRFAADGRPVVLYGHSMGGLVAAGYVLADPPRPLPDPPRPLPDLLVLSSPGFESTIASWKRGLAASLNAIVPRMRISNGPVRDGLSHDPEVRDAYVRDPLCQTSSTVRFGHEAFEAQRRVRAAIDAIAAMPVPTYVFHGSDDPVVPVSASEALGRKGNVTRHVHDGLRHETHHELEHDHVMAEVVEWLEAQRAVMGAGSVSREAVAAAV
jgi:alpha-beta hydrolase superfamily lysophospholipase